MKNTCLSPNTSHCLKGILCICVLVHHLYQFTGLFINTYFGHFLSLLGQWAVAVFIFISGYGLYKSYAAKGDEYINSFIKKRFLPLYITYIVFVVIYSIYDYKNINLKSIITSLTIGGTIVSFGWYFQLIYVLYIGFFLIFKFCTSPRLKSGLMLIFLAAYCTLSILFKQNYIQYIPIASFALGIITAVHDDKISSIIQKFRFIILPISFTIFFAVYMIYIQSVISGRFYLPITAMNSLFCIANLGVVAFAITLSKTFSSRQLPIIDNPVTKWLGELSLEIYAFQGIVLRSMINYITNKALYMLLSIVIIIGISFLFHLIRNRILKKIVK